ncbi:RimJ/RimL family protein N-acetyltransferase [Limimaricola variabilis]|uniref:RimJ/RimL family protein N-acetyltransferase n=1 Tax=Limimaricola variabilis TaxID=1492771 RepID=A0ABR6HQ29_9RHOB|nr:GNAT family N-acetyltransferase [Limimaricola variabilis]MBB3712669.1 RimJ/RimL family protein N-acetyltransferase [Limimaricola variabilis]
MIPSLATDRLHLVPPSLAHLPAEREFFASERSSFVGGPAPRHKAWRVIALHLGHWQILGYGMWAAVERKTGAPVGLVGLWGPEPWPMPELAYHLYEEAEGKGYATEAGQAVLDFARDRLGMRELASMIDPANTASQSVARRLGAENTHREFRADPDGTAVEMWRHDLTKGARS